VNLPAIVTLQRPKLDNNGTSSVKLINNNDILTLPSPCSYVVLVNQNSNDLFPSEMNNLIDHFSGLVLLVVINSSKDLLHQNNLMPTRFPAEWEPHVRTFMSWPALSSLWDKGRLPQVRKEIVAIAQAVSEFEPVVVFARPRQAANARRQLGPKIKVVPIPVDDVWARDSFPQFVRDKDNGLIAVDCHFNGYGGRQASANDNLIPRRMAKLYGVRRLNGPLVTEGGALETDGIGTLLTTESALVNINRNPGKSRSDIEAELKRSLGVKKVIWFKGVKRNLTDTHVDCIARFTSPGVLIISRKAPNTKPNPWSKASDNAYKILKMSTDARGKRFKIIELPEPDLTKITGKGEFFLATYANFYIANGVVVIPKFNDLKADENAKQILQKLFPDRQIVQVNIDTLSTWDGGIHCATHHQPKK